MSNKEAGKGSRPRPKSVRAEEFSSRWEATFGKQHGNKQEDNRTGETSEGQDIIDTSKKAPIVKAEIVQKVLKAKKVVPKTDLSKMSLNDIFKMSLAELQALRINIAEQINASGVHWITEKDGSLTSALDQTDYWKIKELIERKK